MGFEGRRQVPSPPGPPSSLTPFFWMGLVKKNTHTVEYTVHEECSHIIHTCIYIYIQYKVGLSDSAFSTITIVAEAIVMIFDSFTIVCLPIMGVVV